MRNVLPISAGLVVISAVVSATMWSELRTERQKTADLSQQLTDANSRIQALTLASQRNQIPQPMVAQTTAAPEAKAGPAPPPSAQPASAPAFLMEDFRARENEMMKDPEYRKARLAQRRLDIQRNYPGLVEELGLSQQDADALFDLLVANQEKMSAEINVLRPGSTQLDQAGREEISRRMQAMGREQDSQVAALLGPGRYTQWQEYRQTQSGRVQAVQLGTQLAEVGQPLSNVQQRALTTVLVAEQNRMTQMAQSLTRNVNTADPQARFQVQEQAMQLQDEYNRRVLDAASSTLNPRQIASLKQYFETQSAMSSAQMRAEQRRLEAQRSGQTP